MPRLTPDETRELFLAACRAEIDALKPGNVHIHAAGHGMESAHFEAAAAAAAPWIADQRLNVGRRIEHAVEASVAATGVNTNLGILLLSAPLALAAERGRTGSLREDVANILARLDEADAAAVFAAIRRANPGGLGSAPQQDVTAPPTVGLREAMALAADRDRIARAYVTDFEEIFAFGLPTLARIRQRTSDPAFVVTTLHMAYLAEAPDSHIARKFGTDVAEWVRQRSLALKDLWDPVAGPHSFSALLAFDRELKQRNLNPGTTADFVVATLFASAICDRLAGSGPP